ncbi:MAG: hypothetical protein J3K34DRAFT_464920 [Monoraphidium minutum]|nr:MAG: hypothetical protein J3K34DRAFT_464920 [Monoraphidium minutum]
MPRVSALRRLAAPLSAALQQSAPAAAPALAPAAAGAGSAIAAARLFGALSRAAAQPWAAHGPACGCAVCAALSAAHCTGCGCGRCAPPGRAAAPRAAVAAPCGARSYRCCPGLDGAPPDKVTIEYDPEDVDMYIQIADAIEEAFPNVVVDGNAEADGRPGSFEITGATGQLLFSRLQAGGAPPQAAAIVAALGADGAAGDAACDLPQKQA